MADINTIKRRRPAGKLLAASLLFPPVHFLFPLLHQSIAGLRWVEDAYVLYPYLKSVLFLLQLIFTLTGLISGWRIYVNRSAYESPRLAVVSCLLRWYPMIYLLLMLAMVKVSGS